MTKLPSGLPKGVRADFHVYICAPSLDLYSMGTLYQLDYVPPIDPADPLDFLRTYDERIYESFVSHAPASEWRLMTDEEIAEYRAADGGTFHNIETVEGRSTYRPH